jgi:hypothetical protein
MAASDQILFADRSAYIRDASLEQTDDARCLGAWVEEDDEGSRVVSCSIEQGEVNGLQRITPVWGYPTCPCRLPGHLVWAELKEDGGRLYHLPMSNGGRDAGLPRRISLPRAGQPDNPAAALDDHGQLWIMAELWHDTGCSLVLLRENSGIWLVEDLPVSGYSVRPRLQTAPGGLIASWDVHGQDGFRVGVADWRSGTWSCRQLPAPPRVRETLSEVAVGPRGIRYVSRCRERPVELKGGACSMCSEIVVSRSEAGVSEWRDIGKVNVDHGLNPWLGPFCGRRRASHLVPDGAGVWVLWEEKVHPDSMDVPDGRLCAVHLEPEGFLSEPVVAVDEQSNFTVARGGPPEELLALSRGRPERFVERYPAHLHAMDLTAQQPRRPRGLSTNEGKSTFVPRHQTSRERSREGGWRLYFGDPHLHSRFSQDLAGEQDEGHFFGRDFAGLDFVAFTENDFHHYAEQLPDVNWIRSRRNADAFNQPGSFTAFQGYEFTGMTHPESGAGRESHRCVLFPSSDVDLEAWYHGERVWDATDLADHFHGRRVLLHHHHPMGYDVTDDSVERNIEICSGWWNCMRIPDFVENLHRMLDEGHRLGFIGASDNHERNPGLGGALTGVWAEKNTRESLFSAIRARRTYATTGLRPIIRFSVSGTVMGSEGRTADLPSVSLSVSCDMPVEQVRIVRDGQEIHRAEPGETEMQMRWTDQKVSRGSHWYYAHLQFGVENTEVDWTAPMPLPWNTKPAYGRDAWTSPVWLEFDRKERST